MVAEPSEHAGQVGEGGAGEGLAQGQAAAQGALQAAGTEHVKRAVNARSARALERAGPTGEGEKKGRD